MTEQLKQARELEDLQFTKRLQRLLEEQRQREAAIDADMNRRGCYRSGARGKAILNNQARTTRDLVEETISARRELAGSFPELGSAAELESLRAKLQKWVDGLEKPQPIRGLEDQGGEVQKAMASILSQEAHRLKLHLNSEIEILKREFSLNLRRKPEPAATVSVNTGGGPAIVNLGEIRGDVQQVVGTLNAAGQTDLAGVLDRLAAAIEGLADLGQERAVYLEQVRFIARQAVEPEANRQASVVRAVFESLRSRLQDAANVAQVLALAGPAIAHHFGIHWPF
jgi:hypothetical protein